MQLGEKTKGYPYGYGYCQCGCGLRTTKLSRGTYAAYRTEHHPRNVSRRAQQQGVQSNTAPEQALKPPRAATLPSKLQRTTISRKTLSDLRANSLGSTPGPNDGRLVDMYSDLNADIQALRAFVASLESEVEFSIKYLKTFWLGDDDARDVIINRLETALRRP